MSSSRWAREVGSLVLFAIALAGAARAADGGAAVPARGNIVGVVHDESGSAVADVSVEVLDKDGRVIQRATSSRAGGYEIRCIAAGEYDLRLDPGKSGHRGQRVVAPLTADGLTVDWTVARDKPALARAQQTGGPCEAAGDVPGAPAGSGAEGGAAAVGLGAGAAAVSGTIGGLAASGAFDSGRSSTPTQ
jgi:hypothetical protein